MVVSPSLVEDGVGFGTEAGRGGDAAGALTVPKAADVLATHLRRQILDGHLVEGVPLPVERELASQTGLSRGSVREALRMLELEGLVVTRPGRNGGTVVSRPDSTQVEHTLNVFIRGRRVRFEALLEVREGLEPVAAGLAATNRTAEDLDVLTHLSSELAASFDDLPSFLRHNVAWHVAVVQASHNELLHAFVVSLSRPIHDGTNVADFSSPGRREDTVTAHERVLRAIRDGHADSARRRMQRHVHAYRLALVDRVVPIELALDHDDEEEA